MLLLPALPALLTLLLVLRPRGSRGEGGAGPLPRLLLGVLLLGLLRLPLLAPLPGSLLLLDGALRVGAGGWGTELLLPLLLGSLLLAAPLPRPEGILLLTGYGAGLALLPWCQDLLLLWVALQLANLSVYLLLGSTGRGAGALAASLRYLFLSALASVLLLLGILGLYALHGTVRLDSLALLSLGGGPLPHLPLLLLGLGFLLKLGAAPLHGWAPDVAGGAAPLPAALLLTLPKAPLLLALGSLLPLLPVGGALPLLLEPGILSVGLGVAGMGAQGTLRRWLALSTLAHIGYLLLTLAAGDPGALLLYLLAYLPASALLLALTLPAGAGPLPLLAGEALRRPALLLPLGLALLSLVGLPPLPGFAAKWVLLASLLRADLPLAAGVVVVGSVIGAAFYLRVVRVALLDLPLRPAGRTVGVGGAGAVALLTLLLVAFALRPAPLLALAAAVQVPAPSG